MSVLVRAASSVTPPAGAIVHRTDFSHDSLLEAFRGQDAVVNTITMPDLADQLRIIDAAIEAGVARYLPGEFGIDTSKAATVEIVPFLKVKPDVVKYLRSKEGEISWTALITGPFFDWYVYLGAMNSFPFFSGRNNLTVYTGDSVMDSFLFICRRDPLIFISLGTIRGG